MRTLKLHFPDDALPTLDTFVKQTREARVFRRAQAVREVVEGRAPENVSDALSFTYSALRKWVYRFAHHGTQGLVDRPRSGRPPKVTCALEQAPESSGRSRPPGARFPLFPMELSRTCDRLSPRGWGPTWAGKCALCVKKKDIQLLPPHRSTGIPPRLISPTTLSNLPPSSTARVVARSFCSMKTKRSCGALRCPARAGRAQPCVLAS